MELQPHTGFLLLVDDSQAVERPRSAGIL